MNSLVLALNGKVIEMEVDDDFEFDRLAEKIIKDMTPEELEAFKKGEYENFIKILMNANI